MKKNIYYPMMLFSVLATACVEDEAPAISDVITMKLSKSEVKADGSSTVKVTLELNADTDPTLRTVVVKSTGGSFVDGEGTKISTKAIKRNEKVLAEVFWRAPASSGKVGIWAEPELPEFGGLYVVSDTIAVVASPPKTISLTADAFSVYTHFDSELTLSGRLRNEEGNGVDKGTKVQLMDYFEDFGGSPGGSFRAESLSSDGESKFSAIYSPGAISPDQYIWLVATALDAAGNELENVKDSLKVYVKLKTE